MATKKYQTEADSIPRSTAKTGRPKKGIPRNEAVAEAVKANRESKLQSGKVEVKYFVDPKTRDWLKAQKQAFSVDSIGEVLDLIARQGINKN